MGMVVDVPDVPRKYLENHRDDTLVVDIRPMLKNMWEQ